MTPRHLKANPAVTEDRGRIAFQRGPIVFCMEQPDQVDPQRAKNLVGYIVHLNNETTTRFDAKLLDGVMVLEHPGSITDSGGDLNLYFNAPDKADGELKPTTLRLIPYYAWANRGPATMQVWIPYQQA
jgi:uncharacterized protein